MVIARALQDLTAPIVDLPHPAAELRATLALADGARWEGRGLGSARTVTGEIVFTTAMTGYQEALTDPSYRGQVLMFTYPLIGNYGVSARRAQSREIHAAAAIVSTLSPTWEDHSSLAGYLLANNVPALYDVDTRAIAQHIRRQGAMPSVLTLHGPDAAPDSAQIAAALGAYAYDSTDYVAESTVQHPEIHGHGDRLIAVLDCGNKRSVTEELMARGAKVLVLPAHTSAADVLSLAPHGVVISNGPGNPAAAAGVVETVRVLYDRIPLFGICLGHQLINLAAGGSTYKLKFGHRGANHPVQDCETGRGFITTQNHGFAVDGETLPADLLVSHRNLNDGTIEGLRHRTLPIRTVQFHPEGAPGPRDSGIVLDEWLEAIA